MTVLESHGHFQLFFHKPIKTVFSIFQKIINKRLHEAIHRVHGKMESHNEVMRVFRYCLRLSISISSYGFSIHAKCSKLKDLLKDPRL